MPARIRRELKVEINWCLLEDGIVLVRDLREDEIHFVIRRKRGLLVDVCKLLLELLLEGMQGGLLLLLLRTLCAVAWHEDPTPQAVSALLLSILGIKVYQYYTPFVNPTDGQFSELTQWVLVAMFLAALMKRVQAMNESDEAQTKISILLIAVVSVSFVVLSAFIVKEFRNELKKDEKVARQSMSLLKATVTGTTTMTKAARMSVMSTKRPRSKKEMKKALIMIYPDMSRGEIKQAMKTVKGQTITVENFSARPRASRTVEALRAYPCAAARLEMCARSVAACSRCDRFDR